MKKKQKERSGGLGGVLIAALFSVLLGVLLSFFSLLNQPVPELSRAPEEVEPGKIYYLKGNVIDTPQWAQRLAAVRSGAQGSFVFSEGDINAWAKQNLRPAQPDQDESAPLLRVSDFPNVRITDDDHVQVMLRVEAPLLRPGQPFTYQAFGELTPEGFKPRSGWIGQAPLPFVNALAFKFLGGTLDISESASELPKSIADTRIVVADEMVNVHR